MTLDAQELATLARLARLHLDDHEQAPLLDDLERVLGYLGELSDVDVDGLEPMLRPVHIDDGTRNDVIAEGLDPELVRDLARHRDGAFLKIPRTGGDDG